MFPAFMMSATPHARTINSCRCDCSCAQSHPMLFTQKDCGERCHHDMPSQPNFSTSFGNILSDLLLTDERNYQKNLGKCGEESQRASQNPVANHDHKNESKPEKCIENVIQAAISNLAKGFLMEPDEFFKHAPKRIHAWKKKIDCSGFKSTEMKVRIVKGFLIVKAFKEVRQGNDVSRKSFEKQIQIPENVDTKKVHCRLVSDCLIIEAPYQDDEKEFENENGKSRLAFKTEILPGGGLLFTINNKDEHSKNDLPKRKAKETNAQDNVSKDSLSNGESDCHLAVDEKEEESFFNSSAISSSIQENLSEARREDVQKPAVNVADRSSENNDEHVPEDTISVASEDSFVVVTDSENDVSNSKMQSSVSDSIPIATTSSEVTDPSTQHVLNLNDFVIDKNCDVHDTDVFAEKKSSDVQNGKEPVMNNNITKHIVSKDQENSSMLSKETEDFTESQNHMNLSATNTEQAAEFSETPASNNEIFTYRLEMPSYNPESLQVTLDDRNRVMTISAQKEITQGSKVPTESVKKTITIPENVELDQVQCKYREGMLNITAPYRNRGDSGSIRQIILE